MSNAKLFAKLRTLIEDATDADKKHIKKLRKVLRKLKEQQRTLHASLDAIKDPGERRKIEQEIEIITLQRSKGADVYKQLKETRRLAREGKLKKGSGDSGDGGARPEPSVDD